MKRKSSLLLFLIGLGSQTEFHLVGSLGLSELPVYLAAPFIFAADYQTIKRDGFLPMIMLSALCCLGCLLSSFINETPFVFVCKGFATPYAIFAASVVLHRLLRNNLSGLKWIIWGVLLSNIVNIFIFQPETFTVRGGMEATGVEATRMMLEYDLFWSNRIRLLLDLPIVNYFQQCPWAYTCLAPLVSAVVYLFYSEGSGRSAAVRMLISAFLLFIGGKKRRTISRLGNNIFKIIMLMIIMMMAVKVAYSWCASNGFMGEEAQRKYELQTRTGDSVLRILMMGRMEFFCGMRACIDHPILGMGPKPEDTKGYVKDYLEKYGAYEDYIAYVETMANRQRAGTIIYNALPLHSFITAYWLSYGIVGLVFWLYVIYQFFRCFQSYAAAIPRWYGYFCLCIPTALWDIFFSAVGGRITNTLLIVCVLFARALSTNRMTLPYELYVEEKKYE